MIRLNDTPAAPGFGRLLSVQDLAVEVRGEEGVRRVVDGLSFDVVPGETFAIAGESGSGKSMTALALMGLLPGTARVAAGRALLAGTDLLALPEAEMRRRRGRDVAMIFQEPMTSLNPVLTIGTQLVEAVRAHDAVPRTEARARARQLLDWVRIPDAARRLGQHPHELSGGMRQRVMIAMALAGRPQLLIADEPTTALDVTVQAQVLQLIRDLQQEIAAAVVLITHDMGVVAEMADRVAVLREGRKVEEALVADLFAAPSAVYTAELLAAVPRLGTAGSAPPLPAADRPVVQVRDLTVRFDVRGGVLRRPVARVHAVEGVSFDIRPGETLALVGKSGCGKSTTARALMNLVAWEGEVAVAGQPTRKLGRAAMRPVLRDIQMVFQDPFASLDPRMTVGDLVGEPLAIHGIAQGSERHDRVAELFRQVGLLPQHMRRHPHEFSGGQRQRICIARALSLSPRVIIADECLSALDVSVQARILRLLAELQATLGVAYLFISHDLAVVEQICHRVAVMYIGEIVELGRREQVFGAPAHPYTQRLLAAAPIPDPAVRRPPPPVDVPDGRSPLHLRGHPFVRNTLREAQEGHFVAAS